MKKTEKKEKKKNIFRSILFYFFALVFACFFIVPFWFMVTGSFSTIHQAGGAYFHLLPRPFQWNFPEMNELVVLPTMGMAFWNTSRLALAAIPSLLFSSFAAFAFARLRAPGKDFVFLAVLAILMLPPAVTLIPTFMLFNTLDWVNTFLPFYVPTIAGNAFNIFLLRQFMRTVPHTLDEAAKMDGASYFRIYWNIVMPLCKPALAAMLIFEATNRWNDLLGPLIYLSGARNQVLAQVAINTRAAVATQMPPWHVIMLITTISVIPLIVLFFILQKHIVNADIMAGVKG